MAVLKVKAVSLVVMDNRVKGKRPYVVVAKTQEEALGEFLSQWAREAEAPRLGHVHAAWELADELAEHNVTVTWDDHTLEFSLV